MCGIVGYIGKQDAYPILIKGLKRLEYRGYDSAGIALMQNDQIAIYKKSGKVAELEHFTAGKDISGSIGIGHTRWATHGSPTDVNAHPHLSQNGKIAIIHNGIIENYETLKQELKKRGHHFTSETDTEVLVHLIEDIQENSDCTLFEAIRQALSEVHGAYAIVVISQDEPNTVIAARKSSPLVVGIGTGEFFFASDATPLIEYTKNVVYLNDEEIAQIDLEKGLEIKTIENDVKTPYIQELEMKLEALEKGGYEHFMLKEIFEQPNAILNSLRGRVAIGDNKIVMAGLQDYKKRFKNANRLILIACGTSWHSCLVGEYLFEDLARIPVEVEYASEFRYRNPIITENDIVIAISQSGETADTLAALEIAKQKGALTFGICNVVGSSISRVTDCGAYTHAGPEIGVASTKAFTSQLAVLSLIALALGKDNGNLPDSRYRTLLSELSFIHNRIELALEHASEIEEIAELYKNAKNFLYLGRGYNFPVALEGALKLKEISYIHAEGYPAAEMKHGPIALIDENMPVVFICNNKSAYDKIVSNIQEVKARKGKVIAIVEDGDTQIREIADHTITIPQVDEPFSPLISVIPLQLLSYYIAVKRGCNVDQPRNLAKAVTVE